MKNKYQVVPQAATTKKPAKAEVSDGEFRRRLENIIYKPARKTAVIISARDMSDKERKAYGRK
jgi:uncharacterized DUF497 family protein